MRLLRGHLLILGFVGAAIAVPAQAQQPPSNYPPPLRRDSSEQVRRRPRAYKPDQKPSSHRNSLSRA